jgi:hypothetical protein
MMTPVSLIQEDKLQKEELFPISDPGYWSLVQEVGIQMGTILSTETEVGYEYLVVGREINLNPGDYLFQGKMFCRKGGVVLGLLELDSDEWIASLPFDALNTFREEIVSVREFKNAKVILTAFNPQGKLPVTVEVLQLSLRQVLK